MQKKEDNYERVQPQGGRDSIARGSAPEAWYPTVRQEICFQQFQYIRSLVAWTVLPMPLLGPLGPARKHSAQRVLQSTKRFQNGIRNVPRTFRSKLWRVASRLRTVPSKEVSSSHFAGTAVLESCESCVYRSFVFLIKLSTAASAATVCKRVQSIEFLTAAVLSACPSSRTTVSRKMLSKVSNISCTFSRQSANLTSASCTISSDTCLDGMSTGY